MERYRVVGGSGDGRTLSAADVGHPDDFETVCVLAVPGLRETYRRDGHRLVFVTAEEIVTFTGGPLDGEVRLAESVAVADGEFALIPAGDRGHMYMRRGHLMTFDGTYHLAEFEPI